MPIAKERTVPQLMRDQTAWTFRRQRSILNSLHWLRENPDQELVRLDVFNAVIKNLDREILRPESDLPEGYRQEYRDTYRDVIKLKEMLGNRSLPTLENLRQVAVRNDRQSPVAEVIQATFRQASERFPLWADEATDRPGALASGILIEGFGLLLGNLIHGEGEPEKKEELRRTFVLAFEEVLFTDFRNSSLLGDVIPWMRKEKNDFPEKIANEL